jgi:hypothetical protein
MTQPFHNPEDLSDDNETLETNFHDQEPDIQNDDDPDRWHHAPVRARRGPRRPPPRKRHYEE